MPISLAAFQAASEKPPEVQIKTPEKKDPEASCTEYQEVAVVLEVVGSDRNPFETWWYRPVIVSMFRSLELTIESTMNGSSGLGGLATDFGL